MEAQGKVDNIEAKGDGSGHVTWNSAVSTFMLNHLAEMVANGTRTSSGFKRVHLNMCAQAINDHFKTNYTRDNVKNHLWTWQRRYTKILRLKKLSASGWDEDHCMITLDAEHYAGYVVVFLFSSCLLSFSCLWSFILTLSADYYSFVQLYSLFFLGP
jgi:hypothetical protein